MDLHVETDIRLVASIEIHRVIPTHTWNLRSDFHVQDILEKSPHHALEGIQDILLLHK